MTWAKIDDSFPEHPKVVALSDKAFRVHVTVICYCAKHMTDGVVIAAWLPRIGANKKIVAELVQAGVWEDGPDGYVVHDFLLYNPSRLSVLEERQKKKEAGQRGALNRWGKPPKDPIAPAIAPANGHAIADGMGSGDAPVPSSSRPVPADSLRSSASPPTSDGWNLEDLEVGLRERIGIVLLRMPAAYQGDFETLDGLRVELGDRSPDAVRWALDELRRREPRKLPFARNLHSYLEEFEPRVKPKPKAASKSGWPDLFPELDNEPATEMSR